MKKETIIQSIKTIVLALIIAVGAGVASAAWISPPSTPPSGNIDAPINVGSSIQQKLGSLVVGAATGASAPTTGLAVFGNSDKPIAIFDNQAGDHTGWVLTSDDTGYGTWKPLSGVAQPHGTVVIPSAGYTASGSWTVPNNVTSIEVEVVGGGGGGAYHGGAGGGYAYKRMTVTPGQVINYSVGSGGAGSGPYGDSSRPCMNYNWDASGIASAGQNSTFGSITAYGGAGGNAVTPLPLGGGFTGSDFGAIGHDISMYQSYNPFKSDRPSGYRSGFAASRGTSLASDSSVLHAALYGGGGFGDNDKGDNRACGGDGAQGLIIIRY
jgi:hypothetical protein